MPITQCIMFLGYILYANILYHVGGCLERISVCRCVCLMWPPSTNPMLRILEGVEGSRGLATNRPSTQDARRSWPICSILKIIIMARSLPVCQPPSQPTDKTPRKQTTLTSQQPTNQQARKRSSKYIGHQPTNPQPLERGRRERRNQ